MFPNRVARSLVLVSLLAVSAHAQSAPPVFGTYAQPNGAAAPAPDPSVPDTGGLPATADPAQPVQPDPSTASVPQDVPAAPDTTAPSDPVPAQPTGTMPQSIPVPLQGSTPGMPGGPGMPMTPGMPGGPGMPMTPGAALALLGIPYTMSPDGRCATAQAGGYTINVCADPTAGAPAGPGNTLPPSPPKGGTLSPVTVQAGDTLGQLCQQALDMAIQMGLVAPPGPDLWGAGGLVETVARHNQVDDPNLIFPGQNFDFNVDELGAGGAPAAPAAPIAAAPAGNDPGPIASAPGADGGGGIQPPGFFLPPPPPLPNGVVPQLPPIPAQ